MQIPCIKCKGRGFCGRDFCPIYAKAQALFRVQKLLDKQEFLGASPAPFVGRVGYPFVNVGILSPPERSDNVWEYDAPRHWAESNYAIPQIIDFRSSLINSRFNAHIKDQNKFLEIGQEVGMASQPVDVEIRLEKKPFFRTTYDASIAPTGPNATLKHVEITSNPKVPRAVDKVVSDIDLKATEALVYLNGKGFDENYLSRLLSIGTLGMRPQRKLVPTRWSITAVDDMLAKRLMTEVRQYPESDYEFYRGGYLGNYYFVLLFSEPWSYELFESYLPRAGWNPTTEIQFSTDYESNAGRTTYAEECAGGYYAARLALLELLQKKKRQASALVMRFITGEYAVPLGVWVCREATRKAVKSKPIVFDDCKTMLRYAQALIQRKFGYDITQILNESRLLRNIKEQTKLTGFLSQAF
jgi:hypothetical protein